MSRRREPTRTPPPACGRARCAGRFWGRCPAPAAASRRGHGSHPPGTAHVEKYGITKAAVAKQAIPKCNITIITGSDAKDKISKYLNVLYEANPASVGGKLPEDNFYK